MKITKTLLNKNTTNTKLEELKGIVVHSILRDDWQPDQDYKADGLTSLWNKDADLNHDLGAHFVIDEYNLVQYVPDDTYSKHTREGANQSYISNALYNGKPNTKTVGFVIAFPKGQDYTKIEREAIITLGSYIKSKNLTVDCLWRAFDLTRDPSPAQYLDKDKWESFVKEVDKYISKSREKDFIEDKYIPDRIWKQDSELREYLKSNMLDIIKTQIVDDRGIPSAKIVGLNEGAAVNVVTTNHNSDIIYSSQEQQSGASCECNKPFNLLDAKVSTKVFHVDPIYPDTVVPPGTSTNPFNASDDAKAQKIDQSTIPSIEDYENRQHTFDYEKHIKETKQSRGKPINNNDPYPVDKKIQELESHHPKVKIDDIVLKLDDSNHPGCETGLSLLKSILMLSDAVTDQSKRVERRLVLLENITSVLLRYLFRLAARTPINCVYYGGQDIFGKYKCIRCLHDDRVHDGQSMTVDQCLNCSRYEPIIGQIYDILDDSGLNLSQILDDTQMAYMGMEDYIELNRVEKMHKEKDNYKFKNTINLNGKLQAEAKKLEEEYAKKQEELYKKYQEEQEKQSKGEN